MKVSLIITTYNWKEALELSLLSGLKQKKQPIEIVVADDGSRSDTRE
ncbi:MAG: glycosyltransferase, partial [Candidatus Electrothrix sp. AR5]|nr:glycosyltransferase [Candidatus Electrothrix sp. AR5]